jgi:hypothetical protein
MKSFEVQVRRPKRWETDSTYDDRDLAELRARQVDSKDRGAPVRVVEEVFVEKTQKYVLRTIYSDNKSQKNAPAKVGESRQTRTETAIADQPSRRKGLKTTPGQQLTPPANKRKSLSTGVLFGILVLIVGIGIGAMIALEHFLKIT